MSQREGGREGGSGGGEGRGGEGGREGGKSHNTLILHLRFPLFTAVYKICYERMPPSEMLAMFAKL